MFTMSSWDRSLRHLCATCESIRVVLYVSKVVLAFSSRLRGNLEFESSASTSFFVARDELSTLKTN